MCRPIVTCELIRARQWTRLDISGPFIDAFVKYSASGQDGSRRQRCRQSESHSFFVDGDHSKVHQAGENRVGADDE